MEHEDLLVQRVDQALVVRPTGRFGVDERQQTAPGVRELVDAGVGRVQCRRHVETHLPEEVSQAGSITRPNAFQELSERSVVLEGRVVLKRHHKA